jgi:hypothetical protein
MAAKASPASASPPVPALPPMLPLGVKTIAGVRHRQRLKHRRILLVGVELEGGWDHEPDWPITPDGSVGDFPWRTCECFFFDNRTRCNNLRCEQCPPHKAGCKAKGPKELGELRSEPLRLRPLLKWVDKYYPPYTNSTCGLHVHLSVHSMLDYARLTDPEFNDHFQKYMRLWGKRAVPKDREFWRRFEGKNTYCKARFKPIEQLEDYEDRYTQLNYCAYRKHETLEVRLLPAFEDKAVAMNAILAVVRCAETYLQKHWKRADLIADDRVRVTVQESLSQRKVELPEPVPVKIPLLAPMPAAATADAASVPF